MENLRKLFDIAAENVAKNPTITGRDTGEVARKYLSGLADEVAEVEVELKPDNVVRLQDELSDIMWDYKVLLAICAERGWIDSVDDVYQHAYEKYVERAPAFLESDNEMWTAIKNKQKSEIARKHEERYG